MAASSVPFPLWLFHYPTKPRSTSRRVLSRYRRHLLFVMFLNLVISSVNTMYCSFWSGAAGGVHRLRVSSFSNHSNLQCNGVHFHFYFGVISRCRRIFDIDCGTPTAPPVQTVYRAVNILHPLITGILDQSQRPLAPDRVADDVEGFSYVRAGRPSALPIVSNLLSLPERAAVVDMQSVLLPRDYARLCDPANFLRTEAELCGVPRVARPRVFGSRREVRSAVDRLVAVGMVELHDSPPVVESGCFCVSKPDSTALRLIIDCRAVNRLFRDPPGVDLPTPESFANLTAPCDFWVAKSDLSDFYHMISLPPLWRRYFGLPSIVIDGVTLFPRFRSLPMGWSYSVFIAQLVHMQIVAEAALLSPCRLLTRLQSRVPVPVTDVPTVAVYIDDVGVLGTDRERVNLVQRTYGSVASRYGFLLKPSKTVAATRRVDLLGVTVDGERRVLEAGPERTIAAIRLATRACSSSTMTYQELAAIVGRFNWLFLIRRPLLSVFNNVYRWLSRYADRPGPHPLWDCCRRELSCAAGLVTCAFADLSLPVADTVIATDASGSGFGVVSACDAPAAMAIAAETMRPPSCGQRDGEHLYDMVESMSWATDDAGPLHDDNHINVRELDAVVRSIRVAHRGTRQIVLTDSGVVHGVMSKGRSSSQPLLRRCRRIAAAALVSGCTILPRWVPSAVNPADAPSREYE